MIHHDTKSSVSISIVINIDLDIIAELIKWLVSRAWKYINKFKKSMKKGVINELSKINCKELLL